MQLKLIMRFVLGFLTGISFSLFCSFYLFSIRSPDNHASPSDIAAKSFSRFTADRVNISGGFVELQKIPCIINGNSRNPLGCLLGDKDESSDVFIPFSFISSYFDISGKVEADNKGTNNKKVFSWQHSYAKVVPPKLPYSTDGIFMSFDNFHVEIRERVKCISGVEGVPVSTQWSPNGHFYPIQIAQYALSHFSKNITEPQPKKHLVANFEDDDADLVLTRQTSAERVHDDERRSMVLNFCTQDDSDSEGIRLRFPGTGEPYVSFWVKFITNGSITFRVEASEKEKVVYEVSYVRGDFSVRTEGNRVEYGIGYFREWKFLVRDVYIDLVKGLALKSKKTGSKTKWKPSFSRLKVIDMILHGEGFLDNVYLSSSAHSKLFYNAVDWLVRAQDPKGGWPIMVKRKLGKDLMPPWYSAMGQGQAMSALTRAYLQSGEEKFLDSAVKALQLFDVSSASGGVKAVFLDKFVWYEEYPTQPSSFVLNGFIYGLFGLFDVMNTAKEPGRSIAARLFENGLESLKAMLPLYDTGSGSVYDLRHFTMGGEPNLARWDYHATHIVQLMAINSIRPSPRFEEYIERWTGYMKGRRAEHN